MLENRSYMRQPDDAPRRGVSATILVLAATLAVFILQEINAAYGTFPVLRYFVLSTDDLKHGYLWQLLTFQFLHAGPWHFVWNMIALYMFGRAVEESIGKKHFFLLYFGSGVVGGIFQSLLGFLVPRVFGIPVVGASAGVLALVAAFATLDPDREILAYLVLPMRAKHFLWIATAVAIFYILVPTYRGIAHGAHLGGIVAGVVYIRWIVRSEFSLRMPGRLNARRAPQPLVKVRSSAKSPWQKSRNEGAASALPDEFISREVDPILDKISAQGIHSLTEHERKILEAARARMRRR